MSTKLMYKLIWSWGSGHFARPLLYRRKPGYKGVSRAEILACPARFERATWP